MKISIREEHVKIGNSIECLSIFHLSDLHLWYSTVILQYLMELIYKYKPNLIALTGDYYDVPTGANNFRAFLLKISQDFVIVLVRGNHDLWHGKKIAQLMLDIPNCFCVEDSVYTYISRSGYPIHITSWESKYKITKAMTGAKIILTHNPEIIQEKEVFDIDLILAGHLHGGQLIFFTTKDGAHFPGTLIYKYCCERKQINTTTLIVSKGLGDTLPIRFNCPKEIVNVVIN